MTKILSREEFDFWNGQDGSPKLVDQDQARATIAALSEALIWERRQQGVSLHPEHGGKLPKAPDLDELREKGWIE